MIKRINNLVKHPLFSGSAVMIVGSNLGNFFAYLYHLIIGRMLGPSGYGDLASVISLVGLLSLTFGFLGLVIVKFVSGMNKKEITAFFLWTTKYALIAASLLSVVILLASKSLSMFLSVPLNLVLLSSPLLFVSFLSFIYTSFLQGTLRFGRMVVSTNLSLFGRLIFGVLFVYQGYSVFGALFGILVSSILGLVIAFYFLKDFITKRRNGFKFKRYKEAFNYAIPIFIMSVATNSLYMTDVILVKHFFEGHSAGIYASLSTLGKIIFYGTTPIASVMFPLVAKNQAKGGNYKKIFLLSLLLTSLMVVALITLYGLFPKFILNILYGDKFLEGAPYLVWFGLFIGLFSVAVLFLNYFLSKGSTKATYLGIMAAILQIVGIYVFHGSILQVVYVSIVVSLVLLISLLIYFGYDEGQTNIGSNTGLQGRKNNS